MIKHCRSEGLLYSNKCDVGEFYNIEREVILCSYYKELEGHAEKWYLKGKAISYKIFFPLMIDAPYVSFIVLELLMGLLHWD